MLLGNCGTRADGTWLNPVMRATIRPFGADDFGGVLRLWQEQSSLAAGPGALTLDQAIELLRSDDAVAVVAETNGEISGAALGTVVGPTAWIFRLGAVDGDDLGALVTDLEERLTEGGGRRVVAFAPNSSARAELERRDYQSLDGALYLERSLPDRVVAGTTLSDVGGRMIAPGLWSELRGMEEAKEIIERRVILPLERPELADRHGVVSPKAIILFGPPGTGKTTFAKGIASRLQWPFVEIQPAEIGGEGAERQAKLLAESLARVAGLVAAVVFVDEVEDLASMRHESRKVSPSVTNEFLKQIPRLREAPHHLLVCATNWVSRLDGAFLRPGRFDSILPVGPPEPAAREAIWSRYVDEITDEAVDIVELVGASELFTPADIEFSARKAAQLAFEREHFSGVESRATTDDFLAAIHATKPSLTPEIVAQFEDDTERFARD
jgi:transitional endoplasmic reticulum ATPase